MAESKNLAAQKPETKRNWYQRSKITTGLIALIIIFLLFLIIFSITSGPTSVYFGISLEFLVAVIGIYFIVWLIKKRKMLKSYLSIAWSTLHIWEGTSSAQEPKTLKDWLSCHKVTAWSIALLVIVLILNFAIRPVVPGTSVRVLILLLYIFYFILFVVYYLARALWERQKLVKDFTGLWAVLARK